MCSGPLPCRVRLVDLPPLDRASSTDTRRLNNGYSSSHALPATLCFFCCSYKTLDFPLREPRAGYSRFFRSLRVFIGTTFLNPVLIWFFTPPVWQISWITPS